MSVAERMEYGIPCESKLLMLIV